MLNSIRSWHFNKYSNKFNILICDAGILIALKKYAIVDW